MQFKRLGPKGQAQAKKYKVKVAKAAKAAAAKAAKAARRRR